MKLQTQIAATILILLSALSSSVAQDMTQGFQQLEKGEFAKAEVFFSDILKHHPSNMTAQICHARALGLSGNPQMALSTFQSLNQQNPESIEIQLNLAEAHLWNKDGQLALEVYARVSAKDPDSFVAALGTANALSMTGKYKDAHAFIVKAIDLEPENNQAKISKKYIQLAYANQLATQYQKYDEALKLLENNIMVNSSDQESIALKASVLMQAKSYKSALHTYSILKDEVSNFIGQSLAYHFLKDDLSALKMAHEAVTVASAKHDIMKAHAHYNQVLLWNGKFKDAKEHYEAMTEMNFPSNDLMLVEANLAMNQADFSKAASSYQSHLQQDKKSFNAHLGLANAMHAIGLDQNAYQYAFQTQNFYPGQKDAEAFISKLNAKHNAVLKAGYQYEWSSDGSHNQRFSASSSFSLSPVHSISMNYDNSTLSNNQPVSSMNDQRIGMSTKYQINRTFSVQGSYTFINIRPENEAATVSNSEMDINIKAALSKNQTLTIGMSTEVQDFNAALLEQNITSTNLYAKNSMFWKQSNWGVYSEVHVSQLTDGNSRLLIFNSIYKNLKSNPFIKAGVNHLMLQFNENTNAYFSPESYHQLEVFGSMGKTTSEDGSWSYGMDLAFGYQFSDGVQQFAWRTKSNVTLKIKSMTVGVSFAYSSIAAVNNNGFSYLTTSAEVIIPLTKRPFFYKKLTNTYATK